MKYLRALQTYLVILFFGSEQRKQENLWGASGDLTTDCSRGYNQVHVKDNIPSLNINSFVLKEYDFCMNNKNEAENGRVMDYDTISGKVTTTWYAGTTKKASCRGSFTNPFPKTISSADEINDIRNTIGVYKGAAYYSCLDASDDYGDCKDDETSKVEGYNATFIDDSGKAHKISRQYKSTYK